MIENTILLGKSSFALAVISDILKIQYGHRVCALLSNIKDEENDSLMYPYPIEGIDLNEYFDIDFDIIKNKSLIIASIGKSRKKIYDFFNEKINYNYNRFENLIHPSSVIGSETVHGHGFHLSPLSVIAPYCKIGNFVVINRNSSIGHHCVLQDFSTINPGVNIAGLCEIGENAIIGAGTTILDKVSIGSNTVIGAGSVVTKTIPENVIAYGNPCKVIRENR